MKSPSSLPAPSSAGLREQNQYARMPDWNRHLLALTMFFLPLVITGAGAAVASGFNFLVAVLMASLYGALVVCLLHRIVVSDEVNGALSGPARTPPRRLGVHAAADGAGFSLNRHGAGGLPPPVPDMVATDDSRVRRRDVA